MWLTNRSGDACLEIVKMAVETSQHTTAPIGSHLSIIHREMERAYGQFQRHGHYNSDIFGDFRSSFHIPASVKSQIIHSHYKAVIMDCASYEVEINFLNQL